MNQFNTYQDSEAETNIDSFNNINNIDLKIIDNSDNAEVVLPNDSQQFNGKSDDSNEFHPVEKTEIVLEHSSTTNSSDFNKDDIINNDGDARNNQNEELIKEIQDKMEINHSSNPIVNEITLKPIDEIQAIEHDVETITTDTLSNDISETNIDPNDSKDFKVEIIENIPEHRQSYLYALYNLFVVVLISFILFFDRGVIGATLPDIKLFFPQITSVEEGLLAGMFMFGYMFSSLIFAEFASYLSSKYIMLIGCWIFTLGILGVSIVMTFVSPLFPDFEHSRIWFYILVISRIVVSIGEAAVIPLSYTFVDDIMPLKWRTLSVMILSLILPVGVASGYAISGVFHHFFSKWYYILWLECIFMSLGGLLVLFLPSKSKKAIETISNNNSTQQIPLNFDTVSSISEQNQLEEETEASELDIEFPVYSADVEDNKQFRIHTAFIELFKNPSYLSSLVAGISYTFVLGSFIFWGPTFLVNHLKIDLSEADIIFSIISLVTGICGPLVAGIIIYFLSNSTLSEGFIRRKKGFIGFIVSSLGIAIGAPFGFAALFLPNKYAFFSLFTISFFFLLAAQTPINIILISVVPKGVRNYSVSIFIFCIHMFGDFPGPIVFGILKDQISLIWTTRSFWCVLIISVVFYFIGTCTSIYQYIRFKTIHGL